jgi:hypothetical protein
LIGRLDALIRAAFQKERKKTYLVELSKSVFVKTTHDFTLLTYVANYLTFFSEVGARGSI